MANQQCPQEKKCGAHASGAVPCLQGSVAKTTQVASIKACTGLQKQQKLGQTLQQNNIPPLLHTMMRTVPWLIYSRLTGCYIIYISFLVATNSIFMIGVHC